MATAAEATTATPTPAHDGIVVSDPPIVDITALRKSYGTNEVLKGIDLKVQKGEVIAIIGKSGSGKSTLLRCVNGLEVFQEGALSVNGKKLMHDSPAAMRELRQQVGMIFQSFNLFPHLSVGRNIMLAPTLVKARDAKTAEAQARKLLRETSLAVQVIASDLGYDNPANFATAFRARFGLSPRDYRKSPDDPTFTGLDQTTAA